MKKIFAALLLVFWCSTAIPQEHFWDTPKLSERDFKCLVMTLYHEARGEPPRGVLAVAGVILNRVDSERYPDTVCAVVKQQLVKGHWQFSFWKNKHLLKKPVNKVAWNKVQKLAEQAVNLHYSDFKIIKDAMYYYNPSKANPEWARSPRLKYIGKIGSHKFYRRLS